MSVFKLVLVGALTLAVGTAHSWADSKVSCSLNTWLKSGGAQPEQTILVDLKDGPYGSRFGSTTQTLTSGDAVALSLTQMGLSGPRTVWRLEIQETGLRPQVSAGEVGSDTRISNLLLKSELTLKTIEINCPL